MWMLNVLHPITVFIGNTHLPFTRKKITGEDFLAIQSILNVGDVLLTKTHGELTNILIPGDWSHAMIYVGDGSVVEAIGRGVSRRSLPVAVLSKDRICVLKPLFATPEQMVLASEFAIKQIGKPYDYDFKSNNKAFYCSELVYASYNEATGGETPFKLRESFGVPTAIPDDIFLAASKWEVKWIKGENS